MTDALSTASAGCLVALESALAGGSLPALAGLDEGTLEPALRVLTRRHGAAAAPLLRTLAETAPTRELRHALRLALYRLGDSGGPPASRPAVARDPVRAARAWVSGIDGTGSRAVWIVFQGGLGGGQSLCSLILNDESGIVDAAGGAITRRRLEAELNKLYRDQKLPWVEMTPERVCGLVAEALALHERLGTRPPAAFTRWGPYFSALAPTPPPSVAPAPAEPALVERSEEILELAELASWFADPAAIAEEAVALLEMRDSRLVVSDQVKGEREAVIVERAVERIFSEASRERWARRLDEMALIFRATGREEPARIAGATATALRDGDRRPAAIPWASAIARRGLEVAGEVALGRVRLDDVRRAPVDDRRP